MAMRKILVDETNRELCEHGTVGFPMTVNHDDLWAFEGKSVPIHWHNDLEISLPREGEAIYQVYRKSYTVRPGDVLLLNRNVPHSCHSPNNSPPFVRGGGKALFASLAARFRSASVEDCPIISSISVM